MNLQTYIQHKRNIYDDVKGVDDKNIAHHL